MDYRGISKFLLFITVTWLIMLPFAIWKLVEIIIWFIQHFSIRIILS